MSILKSLTLNCPIPIINQNKLTINYSVYSSPYYSVDSTISVYLQNSISVPFIIGGIICNTYSNDKCDQGGIQSYSDVSISKTFNQNTTLLQFNYNNSEITRTDVVTVIPNYYVIYNNVSIDGTNYNNGDVVTIGGEDVLIEINPIICTSTISPL